MPALARPSRRTVAVISAATLLLVAAGTAAVMVLGGDEDVVDPYGTGVTFTDEVTVESVDPAAAQPATVRPSDMPPQIYSEGDCRDAMNLVRSDVFARYPSGLVLDMEGSELLTASLLEVEEDCGEELSGRFRAQELTPWLNYQVTDPID